MVAVSGNELRGPERICISCRKDKLAPLDLSDLSNLDIHPKTAPFCFLAPCVIFNPMNGPEPSHISTAHFSGARAYKLTIEYDGTRYSGWQRQANALSVQQVLEEALEKLLRHPVRCPGAGRTDTGVHALGQVARLITTLKTISAEGIRRGGNTELPADVRIVSAEPCALEFDPRRDARLRWYRYAIFCRPTAPALDRHRLWHLHQEINWDRVEEGLALLRGKHDFKAFRTAGCTAKRTMLTLARAEHVCKPLGSPDHALDFECRSYLHSQIRFMVGLLVDIGMGKHPPEIITEAFETGRIPVHFRIAPPEGLVLMRVAY